MTTAAVNANTPAMDDDNEIERGIGEVIEAAFLVIVSLLGTFGNILVIAAVLGTPNLRTRSNIFIIFLSMMDLLTMAVLAPIFVLTLITGHWPYADVYCEVVGYAAIICLALSVTTLGLIAITRYLAVTRPKHVFRRQCNAHVIVLVFVFLFSFVSLPVILPEFANFGRIGFNTDLGHCTMVCSEGTEWWYCITLFLGGVITTMAIIPAYYALTLWVVRKSRMTVASINLNSERRESVVKGVALPVRNRSRNRTPTLSREELRLTKKLMLLFLIFFICWFPYSIVILADKNGIVPQSMHRFTNLFMWINSCLNPYLYAWMMRSFRNAYKDVTRFNKWRKYLPCKKVREGADTASSFVVTRGGTV